MSTGEPDAGTVTPAAVQTEVIVDPKRAESLRDEALLLDVREQAEWDAGHIDGALHVPMGDLATRRDELPTDQLIVCVCRSGQRSAVVTNALVNAGYEAENLDGGMYAWVEAGLPVVTDGEQPGRVV